MCMCEVRVTIYMVFLTLKKSGRYSVLQNVPYHMHNPSYNYVSLMVCSKPGFFSPTLTFVIPRVACQ